jgi:hypothetical protein
MLFQMFETGIEDLFYTVHLRSQNVLDVVYVTVRVVEPLVIDQYAD